MATRSRILKVPYFTQPTGNTCQSTALKMFATFIEREVLMNDSGAIDLRPQDIYKTINEGDQRPSKAKNSHTNIKWWLEQRFPTLKFAYFSTRVEFEAIQRIVRAIDAGSPVLVSVSHARVSGHIILVIGYEGHMDNASSATFRLIVHDPYGAFDPSLLSDTWGKQRFDRGMSLEGGGESGPGAGLRINPSAASKQKAGASNFGTFYLLSLNK